MRHFLSLELTSSLFPSLPSDFSVKATTAYNFDFYFDAAIVASVSQCCGELLASLEMSGFFRSATLCNGCHGEVAFSPAAKNVMTWEELSEVELETWLTLAEDPLAATLTASELLSALQQARHEAFEVRSLFSPALLTAHGREVGLQCEKKSAELRRKQELSNERYLSGVAS